MGGAGGGCLGTHGAPIRRVTHSSLCFVCFVGIESWWFQRQASSPAQTCYRLYQIACIFKLLNSNHCAQSRHMLACASLSCRIAQSTSSRVLCPPALPCCAGSPSSSQCRTPSALSKPATLQSSLSPSPSFPQPCSVKLCGSGCGPRPTSGPCMAVLPSAAWLSSSLCFCQGLGVGWRWSVVWLALTPTRT